MKIVCVDCLKCGGRIELKSPRGRRPLFCEDCSAGGTCSVEGCAGVVCARGYCRRHYNLWHKHGTATPPEAECMDCGAGLGRPQGRSRYRCPACREAYRRTYDAERSRRLTGEGARRKERVPRDCYVCGEKTPPTSHERRKCTRCLRDSHSRPCSEPDCERPVRARGVCSMHYKRLMRASGAWEPEPWSDRRRNNYHARRALKAGSSSGEPFANSDVFERDGWVCGLCSEPVSPDVAYPDPLSASLDHVVPLSLGGAHSLENVQLAHLSCNVRKGARVVEVGVSA